MKLLIGLAVVGLLGAGLSRPCVAKEKVDLASSLTDGDGKWSYNENGTNSAYQEERYRTVFQFDAVPDNPGKFMLTVNRTTFIGVCDNEERRCQYDTLDHDGFWANIFGVATTMYLHFMGDNEVLWSSAKDPMKPGTLLTRGAKAQDRLAKKLPKNVSEIPSVVQTIEQISKQ